MGIPGPMDLVKQGRLGDARASLLIEQQELAEALGVPQPSVSRWERRRAPRAVHAIYRMLARVGREGLLLLGASEDGGASG